MGTGKVKSIDDLGETVLPAMQRAGRLLQPAVQQDYPMIVGMLARQQAKGSSMVTVVKMGTQTGRFGLGWEATM